MGMHRTVDTVKRKRERGNLKKISFFCDAKKVVNIFKTETINMCINKADYQGALEKFKFLMLQGNLFFR